MKKFIFFLIAITSLFLGKIGQAQEYRVICDYPVDITYKDNYMYYVIPGIGSGKPQKLAGKRFKRNKPWVKKFFGKIKANQKVDIVELIEEPGGPTVIYIFKDRFRLSYDDQSPNDYNPEDKKRLLHIDLPRELFTRKNVLKIYNYVLEHIQLPEAPPYSFYMEGDDVLRILNLADD